jgi:hypothetical protein
LSSDATETVNSDANCLGGDTGATLGSADSDGTCNGGACRGAGEKRTGGAVARKVAALRVSVRNWRAAQVCGSRNRAWGNKCGRSHQGIHGCCAKLKWIQSLQ